MLNYKKVDQLKVIGYIDSDFVNCMDTKKSWLYVYFHGKVWSSLSLLPPPWKLNLWHALRPPFRLIGY